MQQLGYRQLSVKRQLSYCNKPFPEGSIHSHLKEGYVSPQQVSLPDVQTEPSSEHEAPMSQVPSVNTVSVGSVTTAVVSPPVLAAGLLTPGGGRVWTQRA